MDQSQRGQGHGRRHFQRGRRGPDRRPTDKRTVPGQEPSRGPRHDVDVEQIMREIRARIAQRHGIDLPAQQIHELAARRLESILDPRTVRPGLLDELRRAAGNPPEPAAAAVHASPYVFEESTMYESPNAVLRFVRRLLNPVLKLLFNPSPLIQALHIQARLNAEAVERDAARDSRQAEWNALHYAILQKVVTEVSRLSIEIQSMSLRVESLSAKVDFNERRVRAIEAPMFQSRPAGRVTEGTPATAVTTPAVERVPAGPISDGGQPADGARRRRRRRRGRRGSLTAADGQGSGLARVTTASAPDGGGDEVSESDDGFGASPPEPQSAWAPTEAAQPSDDSHLTGAESGRELQPLPRPHDDTTAPSVPPAESDDEPRDR